MKYLCLVYGEESAMQKMDDQHCLDYDRSIRKKKAVANRAVGDTVTIVIVFSRDAQLAGASTCRQNHRMAIDLRLVGETDCVKRKAGIDGGNLHGDDGQAVIPLHRKDRRTIQVHSTGEGQRICASPRRTIH